MARTLRDLPRQLQDIDLVIEARDSRLPLTSVNGAFDTMLERAWGGRPGAAAAAMAGGVGGMPTSSSLVMGAGSSESGVAGDAGEAGASDWWGSWVDRKGKGKDKIVVYTKRDLAESKYEEVSGSRVRCFSGPETSTCTTTNSIVSSAGVGDGFHELRADLVAASKSV
jgi:hypothetical protein